MAPARRTRTDPGHLHLSPPVHRRTRSWQRSRDGWRYRMVTLSAVSEAKRARDPLGRFPRMPAREIARADADLSGKGATAAGRAAASCSCRSRMGRRRRRQVVPCFPRRAGHCLRHRPFWQRHQSRIGSTTGSRSHRLLHADLGPALLDVCARCSAARPKSDDPPFRGRTAATGPADRKLEPTKGAGPVGRQPPQERGECTLGERHPLRLISRCNLCWFRRRVWFADTLPDPAPAAPP